jgi:S1-C subfamily serine protease
VAQSGEALLKAVVTVESGTGSGSGFFIGREGYLLTNLHVVADAKFVRIKLANGRAVVGEVLRADRIRDVALLRTEPGVAPVLAVRASEPQIGEDVYAAGSPFGAQLSGSLTRGVLSARRVLESQPFLQSDVALSPGNSGGPLLDASGQVIGITQMGVAQPGRGSSVNLFIPIGEALQRLGLQLQADGA